MLRALSPFLIKSNQRSRLLKAETFANLGSAAGCGEKSHGGVPLVGSVSLTGQPLNFSVTIYSIRQQARVALGSVVMYRRASFETQRKWPSARAVVRDCDQPPRNSCRWSPKAQIKLPTTYKSDREHPVTR